MTMTASGARISGAGNFAPRSIPLRDNDGLLTSSTVAAFVTQRAMPVQQPLSARPGSSSLSTYSTSGFYTGRSDLLGENSSQQGVASSKQRKHATAAVSPFSQSVKQQLERTAADVSVSLSYQTPRYSYNSSVSGVVAPEHETDALSATSKGRVVTADPATAANQQRRQYQQAPVAKNETASDTRTAVTSGTAATTGIVVPSVALTPSWLKAPVLSHKDLSQVPRIAPVSLRSVVNEELLSQSQHIARAQSLSASTARVVVQPLMHAQHHFSFAPTPRDSGSGASALDRSNAGAITVPHPTSTTVSIPHPVSTATAASSSKAAKPRTQSSTSATVVSTTTTTRAAPAQLKSTNLLNLGAGRFSTKIGVPELKFDAAPLSARLPSHSEPPPLPPPIGVAIPRLNLPAPTGAALSARTTVNTVSAVNTQRTEPQDESATAATSSRTSRTPRRPHFAPEVFLAGQHSTQKPNRQAQVALAGHSSTSPAKKSGPVFVGSPERRPPKWSVPPGQDGAAVGKLDESLLSLASSGRQPQRSTRNSQFKNGSPVRTGPVLAYYHDGGDDEGCGKNGSLHEELLSESMKALMEIDLDSIGANQATSAVSSEAEHPGRSHYPSKFHPDAAPLKTDHLSHSRTSASHAEQQAHDQVEVDPLLGSCASFSSRSSCFTEEREIQQELKKHNLPLLQPEWNTKPLNSKAVATFDQISQLQSDPHSVDGNRGKAFSTQNARVVVAQKKSAYEVECMRLDRLVQDGLCQQKFYLKKIAERAQAVKKLVEEDLHVAGNKVRVGLKRWEDLKIYVASAEEVVVNLEGVYLEEVNGAMEKAQSALVEAGVIALGSKNAVELETGGETTSSSGPSSTAGKVATPSARGINKTAAGIKSSTTTPFCPLFSLAAKMRCLAKNFQAKVSALDKVLAKRRAESRLGLKERIDRLDAEIAEASKIVADLVQLSKYGDLLQSVVSETVEDRVETGVRTLEKAVAKVYSVVVQCKKDQDASFPICGRSELTMREKQQQAGNGSYGDALAQGSKAPASNTGDNHTAVARSTSSPTRAAQHGVVMYASVAATTPRDVNTVVTKKSKKDAHHDIGFVTTCPTGKNTLLAEPNKNVPASHSTRTPRVVGPSSPSLKRAASHATSEIGSETLEAALRAKDETVTIVKDYMPERDTKLTVVVKPASPPEKPKWKVGSYSATSITAPMGRAGRREGVDDN